MNTASYEMRCQYNTEIPMRDGVILRGDLYLSAEDSRYPVLLLRTIFRKETMSRAFAQYDPAWFVRRGYAVYIQDVRGLGQSDGEFDRFTADGPDGYDTVEYLAGQPWCTGTVGMIGSFYAGYLQLMAAAENPPHLRAICPMQTSVSINRDCDNRGFMFYSHVGWCMSRLCNRLTDQRYDSQTTETWLPRLQSWLKDYPRSQLSVWPARDMPAAAAPFPLLKDYFRHLVEGYDDLSLMHKEGRDMDLTRISTPAFYISSWYDSSRTPVIDHCQTQRSQGIDSRALVAPWNPGESPAAADNALESGAVTVNIQEEIAAWFDYWLKDAPPPAAAPIRYYDIVTRQPFAADRWITDGCRMRLYLAKNSTLVSQASQGAVQNTYTHNPRDPLPYKGYGPAGHMADRDDRRILLYTSQPMTHDVPIRGLPRLTLALSSTARDADVMVSVADMAPDGSCFIFCDGATRARYRDGWTPKPLVPDEAVEVTVLLGQIYYTLREGHRLLVQLSGSAFPKYDVNHGTACRPADDADGIQSLQTIRLGGRAGAYLEVPVATTTE